VRQVTLRDGSGCERKDKNYGASSAVLKVVNIQVTNLWDMKSQKIGHKWK
jgi:hypothetical protein